MNSKFKISIPKPCHENWNAMTPKEKGRFCSSCAKTVVDFTKKSTQEIQEYLLENKDQKVCGHFYKKQLDSITIEIPQVTFHQQLSFQKMFVLALLFVMGTTLFSCQYTNGKKQKIEDVVITDSIKIIDDELGITFLKENDSIQENTISHGKVIPKKPVKNENPIICEDIKKDSISNKTKEIEEITEVGEIEAIEGDVVFGMIQEKPPRFQESKELSKNDAKEDFKMRMKKFVRENLDKKLTQCLDLPKGKYRILAQFTIDEKGNVTDIKVRAPHPRLKKEVVKMLQKLPQFIPGQQRKKPVKMKYNLPIAFVME